MDGQVSGLGTVQPFSLLASLEHGFFLFKLCFFIPYFVYLLFSVGLWMTGAGSG